MDGFLVINKDKGMTSHDVVNVLRGLLHTKKVGHTGTLDPDTEGVLVIAVGTACKLINILPNKKKKYHATVCLGKSTETEDVSGNIIANSNPKHITRDQILEAIDSLKQTKTQIPPMYSAVKVNGKKLYEYARKGQIVERKERAIDIFELKLVSEPYMIDHEMYFDIDVVGSKGIYIRTLIYDLAKLLNQEGCMSALTRLESDNFSIIDSYTLESVRNGNYKILSISEVFSNLTELHVNDYLAKLIKNGVVLDERQIVTNDCFKVYHDHHLIAIYEVVDTNKYKPVVIF